MSVTNVDKDLDNLTLTLTAELDAPVERVWQLWADPRQLEGWWGPPGYPATFQRHDLSAGGEVSYFMTGPDGERHHGWWRVISVDPPKSLEFTDGFADDEGNPVDGMPITTARVELSENDRGTKMELRSTFASRADMEKLLEMGAAEGMQQAIDQMDHLLAA